MKLTSFDRCWRDICANLRPMQIMFSWSAEERRARNSFGISKVAKEGITVSIGKATRFIPRRDFENIFPFYAGYKNHKVERMQLRDITVNSPYVISVLRWLELQ